MIGFQSVGLPLDDRRLGRPLAHVQLTRLGYGGQDDVLDYFLDEPVYSSRARNKE